MHKHVARGMQNLFLLNSGNPGRYGYQFSNMSAKIYDYPSNEAWYKAAAANLAEAPLSADMDCFICQDTKKDVNTETGRTSKYADTGEAHRNLDTSFRVCKYRKNPSLKIPAFNLYDKDLNTGKENRRPIKDFVFADHDIYEVVYYTYKKDYSAKSRDIVILSYFLKEKKSIDEDVASAEHVFNTDHSISRTISRFSNQVDVHTAGETAKAQVACAVLSFERVNSAYEVKVALFNNPRDAQEAYANDPTAFTVGLYNGTAFQLLKGKFGLADRNKKEFIRMLYRTGKPASPAVEKIINTYYDDTYPGELLDTVPRADNTTILKAVKAGVAKIEKAYVAKTGNQVHKLYKQYSDSNEPLGTATVK